VIAAVHLLCDELETVAVGHEPASPTRLQERDDPGGLSRLAARVLLPQHEHHTDGPFEALCS
jgi:hypothetical protein